MDKFRALLSALLALGLVIVGGAVAVSASARTPVVRADCDEVAVELSQYNSSGINRVVVTIDGDVVDDAEFQTRYVETFDAPDKYTSYHYEVVVTAHDDPDATKGWTRTFSGDSTPCEQPGGGHTPVNVCHATSSDTNPYVFITVDDDSVKFKGHLMHRDSPNKTWKSDGVFRGENVHAGDPKPDLIGDYTDKDGHLHEYDGDINSKSDCGLLTQPPVVTPATGSYSQECSDNGAVVTIGDLDSGTLANVVWKLTYGNQSKPVVEGEQVEVPSGVSLALSYRAGDSGEWVTVDGPATSLTCEQPPKSTPTGTIEGACSDSSHFVVTGTLDDGGQADATFRLNVEGQAPIALTGTSFEERIVADVGAVVTLEYRVGNGPWTSTGKSVVVTECVASGEMTVTCTATGAEVDLGFLRRGSNNGGHFELVVDGVAQRVATRQQDIAVPGSASLVLRYVSPTDVVTVLDTEKAPAACPPPVVTPASGSFTMACTTTGASVDLGTLSQGTATGGRFELIVNGTAQPVTSAQQDIAVPGGSTLVLRHVPASGTPTVLQSATAPAACTTVTPPPPPLPERGLGLVKSVSPTGAAEVGAKLTYTLVVTATGNAAQTGVTVGDYLPGYAPGSTSGTTTYVPGSAGCAGSGTCTSSYDAATHRVSWGLGTMAAGTSRSVSFQVVIDRPTPAADGSIAAFDVVNIGVVSSEQVPATSSNEVLTPVATVLGDKIPNEVLTPVATVLGDKIPNEEKPENKPDTQPANQPSTLPRTGAGLPLGAMAGSGLALLTMGLLLASVGRRRQVLVR